MLVDQIMTSDMKLIGGWVPKLDASTLEILSEEALIVYLNYLDQLKALFISFVHENFNSAKKKLNWKEIEEKNTV